MIQSRLILSWFWFDTCCWSDIMPQLGAGVLPMPSMVSSFVDSMSMPTVSSTPSTSLSLDSRIAALFNINLGVAATLPPAVVEVPQPSCPVTSTSSAQQSPQQSLHSIIDNNVNVSPTHAGFFSPTHVCEFNFYIYWLKLTSFEKYYRVEDCFSKCIPLVYHFF